MASLAVVKQVGIIVLSVAIGFLYFYLMSPNSKEIRKKQMDNLLSLLVNFVIFIWIGKILANFTRFTLDPVAVLAYPSNSSAFYIGTVFLLINVLYKKYRGSLDVIELLKIGLPTFLAATFMYEFIQRIFIGQSHNGTMLLFITVLIILYTLNKKHGTKYVIILTFILCIGLFFISMVMPLMTFFGYIVTPWYFIGLSLMLIFIVYSHKRTV